MAICIAISLLAALLLILLAVIAIRTALFRSKQLSVSAIASWPVDIAAAAQRLSGAIQVPTVSSLEESQVDYGQLTRFREYLSAAFPRVHSSLDKQVINKHGLLYTWKGSDPAMKPILLLAHQDVVPVTEEGWTHPPFSGAIADGHIWGRGTLDDKGSLMGTLEAVEYLLNDGFKPARSVYMALGFDEEVGGREGAGKIADFLKSQGLQFEYIIDEGGAAVLGLVPGLASWVALVGTAEKGYLSLELSAEAPGGHAAQPPRQTAIGMVATAVAKLQKQPFPARLAGPAAALFEYLGPEMPFPNKMIFANLWLFRSIVKGKLAANPVTDASIRTTTAPTMFRGSPQDNILPMLATAVINFRILREDTTATVIERVKSVIGDPRIKVTPIKKNIFEPSPASSTNGWSFEILSRTIRETLPGVLVAPTLVLGRTDCTYFTGLSPCCYRFVPQRIPGDEIASLHGINERISIDSYAEMINFYIRLMQNSCG
ncbi:MAG: M20 family peptidase [Chloroflexi bacterium]|nr:M20 family peptidase [Chloroflexota bacterium]